MHHGLPSACFEAGFEVALGIGASPNFHLFFLFALIEYLWQISNLPKDMRVRSLFDWPLLPTHFLVKLFSDLIDSIIIYLCW